MGDAPVERLLAAAAPDVREPATRLRALVRSVLPPTVCETVAGAAIRYGWTTGEAGLICAIELHPRWVNIRIVDGATLRDRHRILRGGGGCDRYVRVLDLTELDCAALREVLEAAVAAHPPPHGPDIYRGVPERLRCGPPHGPGARR
jgi:hypothetical protein